MANRDSAERPIHEVEQMTWTEEFETGLAVLDNQHRTYFNLVQDYIAAASDPNTCENCQEELVEKLGYLRRYAVEHFATEQQAMLQSAYPDWKEHNKQHRSFLERLDSLDARLREDGCSDELVRELRFATLDWFISHVRSSDMKVVDFLRRQNGQAGLDGKG